MEPGIKAGTTVEADDVTGGTYQGHRGDIVVIRRPESWPAESGSGDILVKRVLAVAGDTVARCDEAGRVTVNGTALDEEYLGEMAPITDATDGCRGRQFGPVAVPEGQVFLLGDVRLISVDSACHGPVPTAAVVGIVRS